MNNVCFEVKKCIGNAFSSDLETQISKRFPLSVLLTQQTVKKLNLWEKMAREKCLDKSLPWEDIFKLGDSAAASEFCEWVQVGIDVYIPH